MTRPPMFRFRSGFSGILSMFGLCLALYLVRAPALSAFEFHGRLLDKSGKAISGAEVSRAAGGNTVTSATDGRFRLAAVSSGDTLRITHPAFRPWTYSVDKPDGEVRIILYDKRRGKIFRSHTAPAGSLLVWYPRPDFQGTPLAFSKPGTFSATDYPAIRQALSLRLAAGYRVRLFRDNDTEPYIIKPEDDSDLGDDHVFAGRLARFVLEKAPPPGPRPRIFMALHGCKVLADPANAAAWAGVRQDLDGIWFNAAGLSGEQMAGIFRQVRTRVIIKEFDANAKQARKADWQPPGVIWDSRLETRYPDIHLIREAICAYHNPKWCYANEIPDLRAFYVHNPAIKNKAFLYDRVYTLWQPYWVAPKAYIKGREVLWNTPAEQVFRQADGVGVECNPGLFAHNIVGHGAAVRYALARTHDRPGRTFVWFVPVNTKTSGEALPRWFQMVKNGYYLLEAEGVIQPQDVIMIINYGGRLKILPETEPATLTNALRWLLHQP